MREEGKENENLVRVEVDHEGQLVQVQEAHEHVKSEQSGKVAKDKKKILDQRALAKTRTEEVSESRTGSTSKHQEELTLSEGENAGAAQAGKQQQQKEKQSEKQEKKQESAKQEHALSVQWATTPQAVAADILNGPSVRTTLFWGPEFQARNGMVLNIHARRDGFGASSSEWKRKTIESFAYDQLVKQELLPTRPTTLHNYEGLRQQLVATQRMRRYGGDDEKWNFGAGYERLDGLTFAVERMGRLPMVVFARFGHEWLQCQRIGSRTGSRCRRPGSSQDSYPNEVHVYAGERWLEGPPGSDQWSPVDVTQWPWQQREYLKVSQSIHPGGTWTEAPDEDQVTLDNHSCCGSSSSFSQRSSTVELEVSADGTILTLPDKFEADKIVDEPQVEKVKGKPKTTRVGAADGDLKKSPHEYLDEYNRGSAELDKPLQLFPGELVSDLLSATRPDADEADRAGRIVTSTNCFEVPTTASSTTSPLAHHFLVLPLRDTVATAQPGTSAKMLCLGTGFFALVVVGGLVVRKVLLRGGGDLKKTDARTRGIWAAARHKMKSHDAWSILPSRDGNESHLV